MRGLEPKDPLQRECRPLPPRAPAIAAAWMSTSFSMQLIKKVRELVQRGLSRQLLNRALLGEV